MSKISAYQNQEKMQMGLYIHIPFCIKKCDYCDFLSAPANMQTQEAYIYALLKEIAVRSKKYKDWEVATIFFGGGTPSCIDEKYIFLLLCEIRQNFQVHPSAEISIEVNPGTVTEEKLHVYYNVGINRLSIGLQSVRAEELQLLGRIHTYEEFAATYQLARQAGFTNINVDLISALPGQTLEQWMESLTTVTALSPEHISAYSLIIEPNTPFAQRYGTENRSEEQLDEQEELERQIYHQTEIYLDKQGYQHYEISNYARKGLECRHNKSYWKGVPYLGLGLGASSYEKTEDERYFRSKNQENLTKYIQFWQSHWDAEQVKETKQIKEPAALSSMEVLTIQNCMEEFMFLGLRMMKGISINEFESRFHQSYSKVYGKVTDKMIQNRLLIFRRINGEQRLCLTEYGIDVSNYVFTQFLL